MHCTKWKEVIQVSPYKECYTDNGGRIAIAVVKGEIEKLINADSSFDAGFGKVLWQNG